MTSYAAETPRQSENFTYRENLNAHHHQNADEHTPRSRLQQHQIKNGHNYNGFMTQRDENEDENHNNNSRHHIIETNRSYHPHQNNQSHRNDSNNDLSSNQASQRGLSLEYGKTIKLLRNGDEFFNGQKVVINSRKYRYFDVFLDDISHSINARFGAVRNIHTPIHGHRITSLDDIEDGKTYVAAGKGRFVKLK
jgi:hypothetical protein